MVKPKSQSKKPRRGVDFKKIKRKIGRKLPPPKSDTNTEIKSKAIVLKEQSVASEKAGLAVSKKGLTLKELLQHTSHHNAKVRKDALIGIKDILLKHPNELKVHKLAVVEKLRERIGDEDKLVREALYQIFKSVIFPGCAEDNSGPLVSLMMAYIFNAMTHLAIEVRLMAFKFFDLVVQYYPISFSMYAEKILQNYEDMLRRNQLLEDKGKLKGILIGLVQCLSLLPSNEVEDQSMAEKDVASNDVLHAFEPEVARKTVGLTDVTKKLKDLLPILISCFLDFMPQTHTNLQLDAQSFDCMLHILQSIDHIARSLVSGISGGELYQVFPPCQKPDMIASDPFISVVMLKKLWDVFPLNIAHNVSGKDGEKIFMLNAIIAEIFLQLSNWNYSPSALLDNFLGFLESSLLLKVHPGKVFHEKHLLPLITFIPKLTTQISGDWRCRLLQALTEAFVKCNSESLVKLACLSAIEEMINPERNCLHPHSNDPAPWRYPIIWMHELPSLLILLDDKNPLCSKAVLRLLLCMGKAAAVNSQFCQEYDNMQYNLINFFSQQNGETTCPGPFMRLSKDLQELAISCVYYFSIMDSQLLQSLVLCCIDDNLEPYIFSRIVEVLHSSFRAGHIPVAYYTSFHVTLLSRFQTYPEKCNLVTENDEKSNQKTLKDVTRVVCSCLSEIGDVYLVLQMLEKIVVDQICGEKSMEKRCAFLRLLVTLDSNPTRLSDESVIEISHVLPQYMIEVISNVEENKLIPSAKGRRYYYYYLLPCYSLFQRSEKLLNLTLDYMFSSISLTHGPASDLTSKICDVSYVALHMFKDIKMQLLLLSCKIQFETVLQNMLNILSSQGVNLSLEERSKIQRAYDSIMIYVQ